MDSRPRPIDPALAALANGPEPILAELTTHRPLPNRAARRAAARAPRLHTREMPRVATTTR